MSNDLTDRSTEEIWRMLSDRLRQFIQSRIPSAADADDILQSVFLRIHRKLETLQQADRLESWVFQITRNAISDYFRKTPHDQLGDESVTVQAEAGESDNLNREVAGCLGNLIEQLPADLQRAVSMYEREGISQKQIALNESISLSGAKSRVQRGRKALKKMLQDCCQFQFDRHGNVLSLEPRVARDSHCGCEGDVPCS